MAVLEGEPSPFFGITLVGGVVVIGVAFEGALFWIASAGVIGQLIRRLRRPLEIALGTAFCTTGVMLIRLN